MIRRLSIRNFRSIVSEDVEANWITTLVGTNDAGKSNVLRALNLFFNSQTDPGLPFSPTRDFNQFVRPSRGKARQLEIKLTIDLPDSYQRDGLPHQVEWSKVWRDGGEMFGMAKRAYVGGEPFPPRSKVSALLDRMRFTYIPAIKDRAFFSDLQGRLYDVLATVAAQPLRESAAVFETQIQEQLGGLLSSIAEIFAGDATMRLPDNLRQIFENLEISSGDVPLSRRGDGIKIRHIPMLLRFIAEKHDELMTKGGVRYTHIWGFEEPENNVEMAACFKMADNLASVIAEHDNHQLFMTTHSPIFYRMPDGGGEDDPWVVTHFVEKVGTESRIVMKRSDEVDESMGLMPIVAPFVAEAKARYDEIREDRDRMREIVERRCPTLFLEGQTDRTVMQKALDAFAPGALARIHLHDGGADYGSANALASRSLAWLLELRHRPVAERVRALALFDADDAGQKAKTYLTESIEKLGLRNMPQFRAEAFAVTERLRALRGRHFRIPIDLEAHYSDAMWLIARDRGWLEEVELAARLPAQMLNAALRDGPRPLDGLDENDALRLTQSFTDQGKLRAARMVARMDDAEARVKLASLRPVVARIVDHLLQKQLPAI